MVVIRQVFREGAFPVCASCGAELAADGEQLVMDHGDGCSQAASVAAQWNAGRFLVQTQPNPRGGTIGRA